MCDLCDDTLLRRDFEIFTVSALILYLELVLIRWIGTEIRIFAYLGNLVLVVCFFGVGLGCYLASKPVSISRCGINLLLLVVLVSNPFRLPSFDLGKITTALGSLEDSPVWGVLWSRSVPEVSGAVVIVAVLMYLLVLTFVPMGQILGRALEEHPQVIHAYSINIAGSLVGVWLFNVLSWWSAPPAIWLAVAAAILATLPLCGWRRAWLAVGLTAAAAVTVSLGQSRALRVIWSPYQKLTIWPMYVGEGANRIRQGYWLEVNNTFYQSLINLSPDFLRSHPALFDLQTAERSHYNLPFHFKQHIRRMLIVGAGAGNNAAAALRHGVDQIDCVEIDPRIYALGKQLHPEHPYDSPRVHMLVNDARAFYKQARGPYDAIWLGLLDSHTLASSYANLRLDHYVYTTEGLTELRRLLAEDGLLILNFEALRPWIADRLFGEVRLVFGHNPIAYRVSYPERYGTGGGITLVCANAPLDVNNISDEILHSVVAHESLHLQGTTCPTTDDWPYLYLERARIPKLHLLMGLAILGTVMLAQRRVFDFKQGFDWHFFALGAAFLLLEVQTVSRATLLFGMTWVVNAIVISAVLVMILASNFVAWRWSRLPLWLIVTGLAITVAALALIPLDRFNTLAGATKVMAASAFLTAPVFFAGLIFIRSFAACTDKARALGSNLVGALVGGLLESVSFVAGIRALVVLVGLFYLIAILRRPVAVQH
ncbi:MAG TPA: hypothetical protein VL486_01355 [Verrucomicrobiae bacterium]|nr:hypothetical protein [Verrucomicrobiae bacterium]